MPPTTESKPADAYLANKVLTAGPEELRLMLLDGALRFCRQARQGLANKNYDLSFQGFSRTRAIIVELITSMRPEVNPDLCARVSGLYTFLISELIAASHERDLARVDNVIGLLEYERETWRLLMDQIAAEKAGAAQSIADHRGQRATISVEG